MGLLRGRTGCISGCTEEVVLVAVAHTGSNPCNPSLKHSNDRSVAHMGLRRPIGDKYKTYLLLVCLLVVPPPLPFKLHVNQYCIGG